MLVKLKSGQNHLKQVTRLCKTYLKEMNLKEMLVVQTCNVTRP